MKTIKDFEYICRSRKGTINEHSIFANIIKEFDANSYEVEKYTNFGKIKYNICIIKKADFKDYYEKITDDILRQCAEAEKPTNN